MGNHRKQHTRREPAKQGVFAPSLPGAAGVREAGLRALGFRVLLVASVTSLSGTGAALGGTCSCRRASCRPGRPRASWPGVRTIPAPEQRRYTD